MTQHRAVYAPVFLAALAAPRAFAEQKQPHLVFMMADQLRWNTNGYAGGQQNLTVNLDRLASEGLEMHYSWSATPTCTPARAAILTGQSPWNNGMLGYGSVAERYPVEMPRTIASAGYVTQSFGKDHFGWNQTSDHGIDHGYESTLLYDGLGAWSPDKKPPAPHNWTGEWDDYDRWFAQEMPGKDPQATLDKWDGNGWNGWHAAPYVYDEYYHPTAWVGRQAVSFIEGYDSTPEGKEGKPYFLKVSFHRPHSPYDPPQRLLNLTLQRTLPPMVVSSDGWDDVFKAGKGCGPSNADAWCGLMPANESAYSRAGYHASVQFVDEQVGLIYDALEKAGHLENALILWTSDHGDGQGDHFHWRKGYPYEFSAHVPMLLRWPQNKFPNINPTITRGTVIHAPIVSDLRDVFPTFLHATGVAGLIPEGHFTPRDGQSLLCLLADPTGQGVCEGTPNNSSQSPFWRSWLDLEHSTCYNNSNHWNALTDGQWKFIFNANSATEQLFHLTEDPDELVDLASNSTYADTLAKWRARMVAQFEDEQRGPLWVSANGTLMKRTKPQTYSPNFPTGPPPSVGDAVQLESHSNSNCWTSFNASGGSATVLRLQEKCQADPVTFTDFCLTCKPTNSSATEAEEPPAAYSLYIDECATKSDASAATPSADQQDFVTIAGGSHPVVHRPTGLCLTVRKDGKSFDLQQCAKGSSAQTFVLGLSGRLCYEGGDCAGYAGSWTQVYASGRYDTTFEVQARDSPFGVSFVPN